GSQKRLVAYVVAQQAGAGELDIGELRGRLARELPEYMVPSAFVQLEGWPLTANGKLDRRALPAPDEAAVVKREYEAPQGEVEEAIAAIWAELLKLQRVGRRDHFFELGGHSLLVIQMVDRLHRQGWVLQVQQVFIDGSLAALAASVQAAGGGLTEKLLRLPAGTARITPEMVPLIQADQAQLDALVAKLPGGAGNIELIYPLTALQQGLLFHSLLDTEGDPYLLRSILAFDTRARLDAFVAALGQVVARHDSLRSAVFWEGLAEPVQVVCRDVVVPVFEHEARPERDGDAAGGESAYLQIERLTDPRRQRLDLHRAPLLACHVMRDPATGEWLLAVLNHHLVSDHVSLEVMLDEIGKILAGRAQDLAEVQQFGTYVARAHGKAAQETEAAQRAHFSAQLGSIDTPTAPFGLLDTQRSNARVEQCSIALDPAQASRLRELARANGVTPAVLFHLAWAQVLALCTGQEEVVFGTVLSGRMRNEQGISEVVGMLLNTLPVRISLQDIGTAQAIRHVHQQLVELSRYEQTPLTLAQQCSGVAPGQPLFTSLLNYRHSAAAADTTGAVAERTPAGWDGVRSLHSEERSNYPLSASVTDNGSGFTLSLHTIEVEAARLGSYFICAVENLIKLLAEHPQAPISMARGLPEAERHQVLEAFNATTVDYAGNRDDATLHGLFEQQVALRPQAIALEYESQRLSYAELNLKANRLAHALIEAGVQPDDRVAICLERGPWQVVAQLAALKAGGAYVALDARYPQERLAFIVADSRPRLLLTERSLLDAVSQWGQGLPLLVIDDAAAFEHRPVQNPLVPGLRAHHMGCLIYTSGSTGLPKGVVIEHRSLLRLVHNSGYVQLSADDCIAHGASVSFDAATWEVWAPLTIGARLLALSHETMLEPQRLQQALLDGGVTVLFLTIGLFHQYVDQLQPAFRRLRYLLTGGDVIDAGMVRRLLDSDGRPQHFLACYGPTEATTYATVHEVTRIDEQQRSIPIGKPIDNTRIYILDARLEPLPIGVPGEIWIGGPGVARGYLDREELTAERFRADPFVGGDARMYKTGDLGKWLPEGTVEFLGRNDFQVKIRGFRVEPGEIEVRLKAFDCVREAVVVARQDDGNKRLVAYLIAATDAAVDIAALRAAMAGLLPDYMVPSAFVLLERFPLTGSGKIDRKALPAPDLAAVVLRDYVAPQGAMETACAEIWAELLKLERVGRDDHFFELGGHSLFAVQLNSRLRERLGVNVPLRVVFEHPVLADFASQLASAEPSTGSLHGDIPRADRGRPLPLSWAQQRLWFTDQLDHAASVMYNLPIALKLSGTLDEQRLRKTLAMVVARHESLRTTFVAIDGQASQRIAPADIGFTLAAYDLSGLCEGERETALNAHRRAEETTLFDLATGPLIRGRLLRLAPTEHLLIVTQHHIISDGWSIGVLVREVNAIYGALLADLPPALAQPSIQYPDYAQWQRERLSGAVLDQQLGYWRGQLGHAPALLTLPLDRPRPATQSFAAATLELRLTAELSEALRQLARRHGCTIFMVLLAGWSVMLSRLSSQRSVVIGSGIANREHRQTEDLIGFFVNTLCFHIDAEASHTVAELLAQVRRTALEAYAHQELPFDQVVEALNPARSLSHNAVFQTMLSMNETPTAAALELGDLTVETIAPALTSTSVDLSASLVDGGDAVFGTVIYARDLLDAATVARWSEYFVAILAGMAADDQRGLSSIDMLGANERAHLQGLMEASTRPLDDARLVHERFEALAELAPQRPAVQAGARTIGYEALNAMANRIAHRLIGMGIKTGDRVAICVERNPFMVAAVLGVLKAGAAFVPLDPSYPPDRLSWLLQDCAPVALLTETAVEDLLPALSLLRVLVLDDDAQLERQPGSNPGRAIGERDLAYVIYTSGSTGRPKGVMLEHRGLRNTIAALNEVYGFGPGSRLLQFVSFGFDVCVSELLMPLTSGGTVHLLAQQELLGERLAGHVRAQGITHLCMPVAALATVPLEADLGALQTLI
ncbi:amino acid adenylation domain-containing protein, partial [Paucibacter sp. APW11]